MKELQSCKMETASFLEDAAIRYFAKTSLGVRGFILPKALRDELANASECALSETSILIGEDQYEMYTSNYNAIIILDMAGNVESVK